MRLFLTCLVAGIAGAALILNGVFAIQQSIKCDEQGGKYEPRSYTCLAPGTVISL